MSGGDTDTEIQIMATIYHELRRLNTPARERVMVWVLARIEQEKGKDGAESK